MNPNRNDNLKPFKKGQDDRRNVTGKQIKKPDLEEALAKALAKENVNGVNALDAMIEAVKKKALKSGDYRAFTALLEYAYGKPRQQFDVTSGGRSFDNRITQIEIIKTVQNEVEGIKESGISTTEI